MRKGFAGLSALAEKVLGQDPYCGHLFVFRGRRGDLIKIIWWDGQGACLFSKRLERGRPGPGLLAHVLVSKYADHLPLYRQSQIFGRQGIDLDRSTLADWVGKSTALLEPLADAVSRHVMDGQASRVLLARNIRLGKLIEKGVSRFDYTYDFGDDWRHRIEITALTCVADEERLPRFVAGKYHAPPEDIGGPPGYEYFLEIAQNPNHPDRENYEHILDNPFNGPFDRNDIQSDLIKTLMSRVARRKPSKPNP